MHCFTSILALPEECTHAHSNQNIWCVPACADSLGTKQVTCNKWNKGMCCGDMAGTIPWIIPVLNFHMPKDFVLLYLPSVFDLFWEEAISPKSWSWNIYIYVIELDCKRLYWTFLPLNGLVISIISKKETVCYHIFRLSWMVGFK